MKVKNKETCGYKTCDDQDQNKSKMTMKNKEGVLSSFIIPRGQKRKLTIAQNEQTGQSNETRGQSSNVTRPIRAAKVKGIENMSEVMINENEEQRNMWLEYL